MALGGSSRRGQPERLGCWFREPGGATSASGSERPDSGAEIESDRPSAPSTSGPRPCQSAPIPDASNAKRRPEARCHTCPKPPRFQTRRTCLDSGDSYPLSDLPPKRGRHSASNHTIAPRPRLVGTGHRASGRRQTPPGPRRSGHIEGDTTPPHIGRTASRSTA